MDSLRQVLVIDGDEGRVALRKLGGLLLGIGMVTVFLRRSAFADPWGDFLLFLVLLAPFLFLSSAGLLGTSEGGESRFASWQPVYLVFGVLLVPLVGLQFVELVGGDPDAPLNLAWIFLATAVEATIAATMGRLRYGFFLAGIALIVAWLAFWQEVLADGITGDFDALRALLIAIAAILLAAAWAVRFRLADGTLARASELVTAAGVAAVGAGALSFAEFTVLGNPFLAGGEVPEASLFWDLELLLVSLLLVGYATRFGVRGPAYVGAVGLAAFTLVVGADIDDDSPSGKVIGWPFLLVLAGAAAFLASLSSRLRIGSLGLDRWESGGDAERSAQPPPQPPPHPPPPAPPAG
jgi:hypothetical protein